MNISTNNSNTLIITCSPKKNPEISNSQIIAKEFVSGMKNPYPILRLADSNHNEVISDMRKYDTILIVFPLYVHSVPGSMLKFIEKLSPSETENQKQNLGFIIQFGFTESHQASWVEAYLIRLAEKLNYNYLGAVSKGECAGIYQVPKMFKDVLSMYRELGIKFEQTNSFDKELSKQISLPVHLDQKLLKKINRMQKLGLTNLFWNHILRKNKAFKKRYDAPFADYL